MTNEIRCPKCRSNQVTADKKGFSGTKAVGGAILTGGVGLLAGTIGSNKIIITCLACGHQFKPGEDLEGNRQKVITDREKRKKDMETIKSPIFWIFIIIFAGFMIWLLT
jgi:predicted nucleic-acid-binding Zn-ribbon protein